MVDSAHEQEAHLTMANEDYLEWIYRLSKTEAGQDGVRSVDVAEASGVSKASVNKAISTLRDAGYVEQDRYGRINLTPEGAEYAAHVWRAHRMLRAFLIDDLGVDPAIAEREACQMEHALSFDTQNRWIDYLAKQGIEIDE